MTGGFAGITFQERRKRKYDGQLLCPQAFSVLVCKTYACPWCKVAALFLPVGLCLLCKLSHRHERLTPVVGITYKLVEICRMLHCLTCPHVPLICQCLKAGRCSSLKSTGKTLIWEPVVGAAKRAITNLQSWLRTLGFSLDWRWHRHVRGWLGCCFANISHDLTDHWTYVERLCVPPGFVAVQEDKDKASCWLLPCVVYNKLFALMVKQDAQHWVRHTGNVVEVVEHYRQLHEDKLPSHLCGFCAHSRWKQWRLPYMYINIKSKCFESSVGRVCLKPSHACLPSYCKLGYPPLQVVIQV